MKEKKKKKVSLSTFLLIISLIVIACMAYYIYNLKTNTPNTDSQISKDSTNEIDFSEEEIKKALTNYLNIFYGSGSQEGLLVSLEFFDYLETNNFKSFEVKGEDGYNILYKKTNIKYSDFMAVIKEYLSEELFEKINYNAKEGFLKFIEDDGLLCYASYGASGMEYGVDNITLKDDNSDLTYIAKIYEIPMNSDFPEVYEEIEFSIKNYNGKCVISHFE